MKTHDYSRKGWYLQGEESEADQGKRAEKVVNGAKNFEPGKEISVSVSE